MICVAICTRQRPEMLRRMLNSCANVTSHGRNDLVLLVIENGAPEHAEAIISEFSDRLQIKYVNEPNVGLVHARNTAIESFLKTDADWYASVDDDGAITANWVDAYLSAIAAFPDAQAFAGPTPQVELENESKWLQRKVPPLMPLGHHYWNVSTANVLFRRDILSSQGENMRFDLRYNLSGGEDTHFFRRLHKKNIPILWVPDAVILERVDESRGFLRNRIRRTIQFSQNRGKIVLDEHGVIFGAGINLGLSVLFMMNAVMSAIASAVMFVGSKKYGYKMASNAVFMVCITLGRLKAVFLKPKAYYAVTDGN